MGMKLCLMCKKEIKEGDWTVECRQFKLFGEERLIHLNCLSKGIITLK